MRKFVGIALVAALGSAPLGWWVTDRLEADNRFCVSCHVDATTPLHDQKMSDFGSDPAMNLASLHTRAEPGFRCIDCHGGASFPNKLRVKAVAGRDALMWLIGAFEEPDTMEHPLWDEDCVQCHATYASERKDDFHAITDHNIPTFEYRCVECHAAHPTDGAAVFHFMTRARVESSCQTCHEEL